LPTGNLFYNRSSCGVLETAEMSAEMIWPELIGLWGHHGERYVALGELSAFCSRVGAPAPHKPVEVEDVRKRPGSGGSAQAGAGAVQTARVPTEAEGGVAGEARVVDLDPLDPAARAAMTQVEVVAAQLEALHRNDFAGAFAHNSEANQTRFGYAGGFETVVTSSASFNILLHPECKTRLASVKCVVSKIASISRLPFRSGPAGVGPHLFDAIWHRPLGGTPWNNERKLTKLAIIERCLGSNLQAPVDGEVNSVTVAVDVRGHAACFVFNLVRSDGGLYTDSIRIEC
jgi:hypothetical protein